MTDPSTPTPSEEAVIAAMAQIPYSSSEHEDVHAGLTAAYAIDAPRIAAEAAAEARAATLREVEAWFLEGAATAQDNGDEADEARLRRFAAYFNPEANT